MGNRFAELAVGEIPYECCQCHRRPRSVVVSHRGGWWVSLCSRHDQEWRRLAIRRRLRVEPVELPTLIPASCSQCRRPATHVLLTPPVRWLCRRHAQQALHRALKRLGA